MTTQAFPSPIPLGPVTHVRLAPSTFVPEQYEHITDLLVNGVPYTVAEIIFWMGLGVTFYVLDPLGRRVDIELVHDVFATYVRSKPDYTTRDNLLNLPRF
jgi:hypothetical protein